MSNIYYIEKILDKRIYDGKTQYNVKWQDYPDENASWEPINYLMNYIPDMIEEYEKKLSQKTK
jgi:hypothetical protein